jgi:hypothetical protein
MLLIKITFCCDFCKFTKLTVVRKTGNFTFCFVKTSLEIEPKERLKKNDRGV